MPQARLRPGASGLSPFAAVADFAAGDASGVAASPSRTGTQLPSGPRRSITMVLSSAKKRNASNEAFRSRRRLDRDRPVKVAPFRVNLVEGRNRFGVGDDRCFAQLAQLVQDSEGIDPTPQDIGAGRER